MSNPQQNITFETLSFAFNRAFRHGFSKEKFLTAFLGLAASSLFFILFYSSSCEMGPWAKLGFHFIPFFLSFLFLFPVGVVLIRLYYNEIKGSAASFFTILSDSAAILAGTVYVILPLFLGFLALWIASGFFFLFQELPYIGPIVEIFLSPFRFVLHFSMLLLALSSFATLHFVAPLAALNGTFDYSLLRFLFNRFKNAFFENFCFFALSLLILALPFALLMLAFSMTDPLSSLCHHSFQSVLKYFFLSLPLSALLSPAVVVFFNFSAESQRLLKILFGPVKNIP